MKNTASKTPAARAKRKTRAAQAAPADALTLAAHSPSAPFRMQPDEIESALVRGDHEDLLKRYFGEQQYAELRALSSDAGTRSLRGAPRVLILPGIMGATLGTKRKLFLDDVVWIDPVDVAAGNLTTLALIPGPVRHEALGVILFAYLKIKLTLKMAGYNADFHPFDWRQSIDTLGRELAKRICDEPADVALVAHSMGGLVSRAALTDAAASAKVKRLIMLGTPNFGSFVPVQALRAIYPIIRKIALIDLRHSPEELSEKVFNTFPGLYQMLPAPEKFSAFDWFDLQSWPKTGPLPRQPLLDSGRKTQTFLAAPDGKRDILIAGINQDTITDVHFDGADFTYSCTKDGDGTVPLALAQLPGVATYYAEESHGSLPNNGTVIKAVQELLALGKATALPQQWISKRAAPRVLDEAAVRSAVPDAAKAAQGMAASDQVVRELLEEVAAPQAKEEQRPAGAAAHPLVSVNGIVVGRRRQRRLDLRLAAGSITEANSKAYVVGVFRDVTPTGAAEAIDRRMQGAIAEFGQRRMFNGGVGEVFIVPTGRHALIPDHILLAGLGAFDQFTLEVLEVVSENVIRTLVRSGVDDFATVIMGGASGRELGLSLEHMLAGFVRGLLDEDKGRDFRRVTLCETHPERFNEIRDSLYRLASTNLFDEIEVSFEEQELPVSPQAIAGQLSLAPQPESPAYLLVRHENSDGETSEYQTSLLTSGSKAAVITGRKVVNNAKLAGMLGQIGSAPRSIQEFGRKLSELTLNPDVLKVLETIPDKHLVIVHDVVSARIPWETLRVGGQAPALGGGLSRRYSVENMSVAKLLEQRKQQPVLKILLVVDPGRNLVGAVDEGRRITELFASRPGFEVVKRFQEQAAKAVLLADFSSGEFDVLHYAGHAFFNAEKPAQSGIICADGQVLSGADLASIARLPNLVFFNACESARTRKGVTGSNPGPNRAKDQTAKAAQKRIDDNMGLAEAYLRGGVANYIGTYWPVADEAASAFAETFYSELIDGSPLSQALLAARRKVEALPSADWADYVLYGSADFRLKKKAP